MGHTREQQENDQLIRCSYLNKRVFDDQPNTANGFAAAIYTFNDQSDKVYVVFRGSNESSCWLGHNVEIAQKRNPVITPDAIRFTEEVCAKYPGKEIIITGYSKGAVLALESGLKTGKTVVAIECPGYFGEDPGQHANKVYVYQSLPNLVNDNAGATLDKFNVRKLNLSPEHEKKYNSFDVANGIASIIFQAGIAHNIDNIYQGICLESASETDSKTIEQSSSLSGVVNQRHYQEETENQLKKKAIEVLEHAMNQLKPDQQEYQVAADQIRKLSTSIENKENLVDWTETPSSDQNPRVNVDLPQFIPDSLKEYNDIAVNDVDVTPPLTAPQIPDELLTDLSSRHYKEIIDFNRERIIYWELINKERIQVETIRNDHATAISTLREKQNQARNELTMQHSEAAKLFYKQRQDVWTVHDTKWKKVRDDVHQWYLDNPFKREKIYHQKLQVINRDCSAAVDEITGEWGSRNHPIELTSPNRGRKATELHDQQLQAKAVLESAYIQSKEQLETKQYVEFKKICDIFNKNLERFCAEWGDDKSSKEFATNPGSRAQTLREQQQNDKDLSMQLYRDYYAYLKGGNKSKLLDSFLCQITGLTDLLQPLVDQLPQVDGHPDEDPEQDDNHTRLLKIKSKIALLADTEETVDLYLFFADLAKKCDAPAVEQDALKSAFSVASKLSDPALRAFKLTQSLDALDKTNEKSQAVNARVNHPELLDNLNSDLHLIALKAHLDLCSFAETTPEIQQNNLVDLETLDNASSIRKHLSVIMNAAHIQSTSSLRDAVRACGYVSLGIDTLATLALEQIKSKYDLDNTQVSYLKQIATGITSFAGTLAQTAIDDTVESVEHIIDRLGGDISSEQGNLLRVFGQQSSQTGIMDSVDRLFKSTHGVMQIVRIGTTVVDAVLYNEYLKNSKKNNDISIDQRHQDPPSNSTAEQHAFTANMSIQVNLTFDQWLEYQASHSTRHRTALFTFNTLKHTSTAYTVSHSFHQLYHIMSGSSDSFTLFRKASNTILALPYLFDLIQSLVHYANQNEAPTDPLTVLCLSFIKKMNEDSVMQLLSSHDETIITGFMEILKRNRFTNAAIVLCEKAPFLTNMLYGGKVLYAFYRAVCANAEQVQENRNINLQNRVANIYQRMTAMQEELKTAVTVEEKQQVYRKGAMLYSDIKYAALYLGAEHEFRMYLYVDALFKQHLMEETLNLVRFNKDGDGLFRAVACYTPENPVQLRQLTVDYIKANQEFFEPFVETSKKTFADYILELAKPGTFADELALRALCHVLKRQILLVFCGVDLNFMMQGLSDPRLIMTCDEPIYISYDQEQERYDGLRLRGELYLEEMMSRQSTNHVRPERQVQTQHKVVSPKTINMPTAVCPMTDSDPKLGTTIASKELKAAKYNPRLFARLGLFDGSTAIPAESHLTHRNGNNKGKFEPT